EAGRRWPADHCVEAVLAGLIDPAVRLKGEADVAECVECPRGGSDEPVRGVAQSRRAPATCCAETGDEKRKRTAPAAGCANADGQTSRECADRGAVDSTKQR